MFIVKWTVRSGFFVVESTAALQYGTNNELDKLDDSEH